jgi:hypothetical protein
VVDEPLKLSARDAVDLAVASAMAQDALTRARDMTFQERERRFLILLDRFMWERDDGDPIEGKLYNRVRSVIHFDDVVGIQTLNIDMTAREEVLELLTVAATDSSESSAKIELVFAGGGVIRLDVDCIECRLTDRGRPWMTRRRPVHAAD